jgi:anti-anti-sigma factor
MLAVTVTHSGDRTEIQLTGEIDHFGASEFAGAFATLKKTVCINLGNVRYISSYGVGLMLKQMAAISREHKVEFAECTEMMVDQFQMLQFSRYGRIVRAHESPCTCGGQLCVDDSLEFILEYM